MKILKSIIVTILFLFEGLMSVVMTYIAFEEYSVGEMGAGMAAVALFYGFALVSLAELLRMMRGREKIILPMLGMKAVVVSLAIAVGMFADYSVSGDRNAMGVGVTFVILTIVLIVAGFGIKYSADQKKLPGDGGTGELEQCSFTGFSAEWYFDDVAEEYVRLHNPYIEMSDEDGFSDEDADKIFTYACNRIAYLFEWLLKRNGLSDTFLTSMDQGSDELNALRNEQGNPSEYIYYNMDGKLCRDDVAFLPLLFLHTYYERMGFGKNVREISYGADYDEIVLSSRTGDGDILYCFDFSWEKYRIFEKRLDERYKAFLRAYAEENLIKLEKTIFSETFRQELGICIEEPSFPEPFADAKRQAYYSYIESCLWHVNGFPLVLVDAICEKLNDEWEPVPGGKLSREEFLAGIGAMDVCIYKPHGDEIAYVLRFEADFEPEHGVAVRIRNDRVLSIDYRMDAGSPWEDA